jgi:hypothetical protein
LPRGTAEGALAGAGRAWELAGRVWELAGGAWELAGGAWELAGGCGAEAGARPPQPAPASDSAAASTAGTTTVRILVMPAQPTRPRVRPQGEPTVLGWRNNRRMPERREVPRAVAASAPGIFAVLTDPVGTLPSTAREC